MSKNLQQATTGGRDSPLMSTEDHRAFREDVLNRIAGIKKNALTPEKKQGLTQETVHFAERMGLTLMASTAEGYDASLLEWGPVDGRFVAGALLKFAGAGQMLADVPGHDHTFAIGDGILASYAAKKGRELGEYLGQEAKTTNKKETPAKPKTVTQAEVGGYPREVRMTTPAPQYHSKVPGPLNGNGT